MFWNRKICYVKEHDDLIKRLAIAEEAAMEAELKSKIKQHGLGLSWGRWSSHITYKGADIVDVSNIEERNKFLHAFIKLLEISKNH